MTVPTWDDLLTKYNDTMISSMEEEIQTTDRASDDVQRSLKGDLVSPSQVD